MPTVDAHFARTAPEVRHIYDRVVAAARKLGPVDEDPKKTSIHLNRRIARVTSMRNCASGCRAPTRWRSSGR